MPEQYFPVDIYAVKEYGIAKWQHDFFWPVSDDAYTALCNDINNVVREYINTLPQEYGDVFLIKRNILLEYWHFLHAVKVLQELRVRDLKPLCSNDSLWYQALIDGTYRARSEGFTGK